MADSDDLFTLAKKFWTDGAESYRRNVDDSCLAAFTEMAGVISKDAIAAIVEDRHRRDNLKIEPKGVIEPTANLKILSHKAKANRPDGTSYAAWVRSAYVQRDGTWKLAFHQQTPLQSR